MSAIGQARALFVARIEALRALQMPEADLVGLCIEFDTDDPIVELHDRTSAQARLDEVGAKRGFEPGAIRLPAEPGPQLVHVTNVGPSVGIESWSCSPPTADQGSKDAKS
jgi:hypothetical protein